MKKIFPVIVFAVMTAVASVMADEIKAPNYNTPESDFVAADWNIFTSEFRDSLDGKYIYLDGVYVGVRIPSSAMQEFFSSMMKLSKEYNNPANDPSNKLLFAQFLFMNDKGKNAIFGYHYAERESGMQLVNLNPMDKIRVYGYVPPRSMKGGYLRDGSYREKLNQKTSGGDDNCFPAFGDYGQCDYGFIWMMKVVALPK